MYLIISQNRAAGEIFGFLHVNPMEIVFLGAQNTTKLPAAPPKKRFLYIVGCIYNYRKAESRAKQTHAMQNGILYTGALIRAKVSNFPRYRIFSKIRRARTYCHGKTRINGRCL